MERRTLSLLLVGILTVGASACSGGADPKIDADPQVTVSPGEEKTKPPQDPPSTSKDSFLAAPLRQVGPPTKGSGAKPKPGGPTDPGSGDGGGGGGTDSPSGGTLLSFNAGGTNRLITNAYAKWNGGDPQSHRSSIWEVTSGSLFARNGVAWNGNPDGTEPNADSTNGTGSSIFRMNTKRRDFGNVRVDLRVRNLGLRGGGPDTDGVHVWMHYQDQTKLYVASLNRRDNHIVIKKKLPPGDENGGHYIELANVGYQVPIGAWQNFSVTIRNTGGAVVIAVLKNGRQLVSTTDRGNGGEVIAQQGAVGIRSDRCEFEFAGFQVRAL